MRRSASAVTRGELVAERGAVRRPGSGAGRSAGRPGAGARPGRPRSSTSSARDRPTSCRDGSLTGGDGVGHLVDRARQPPGRLEPPEQVHPPVAAGHPGVPADRQDHVAAGPGELVGDLHPGRGGADDEDATRLSWPGLRYRSAVSTRTSVGPTAVGTSGRAVRSGGHDDRPRPPGGVVRADLVAAGRARWSGGSPSYRSGPARRRRRRTARAGSTKSPEDRKASGSPAVCQPGSRFSQFGREQVQRVPARGAPALADPAAVEDDVLAPGQGEQAAHGQAGVAGADDDGVDGVQGGHDGSSRGPGRPPRGVVAGPGRAWEPAVSRSPPRWRRGWAGSARRRRPTGGGTARRCRAASRRRRRPRCGRSP